MREPYSDLYVLFRHNPAAEEYFNTLPDYVQDQISAQYRSVDSLERLRDYAARLQQGILGPTPVENIGGQTYLPPPRWF